MSTPRIYTGIGSRQTPLDILAQMRSIARQLASRGWLLRSGGEDGADTAFENGCVEAFGRKEIYLPWRRFNNRVGRDYCYQIPDIAYDTAQVLWGDDERWKYLKGAVKKLHARNTQQVLGRDLNGPPAQFVLCWTPGGSEVGGTCVAIQLAHVEGVRVVNLAVEPWHWNIVDEWVDKNGEITP